MNKKDFLHRLSKYLGNVPREDEQDIISDFEEHFEMGKKEGRSEEELAESLGDPRAIANQFRANIMLARAEKETTAANITRAVFASLGLGFFNLIFILGPFLVILGLLIILFAAAISIAAGGITGLIGTIFSPLFPGVFNMLINPAITVFASIGLICLGVLFFIGIIYLTRGFFRLFIRYIKFNVRIISGRERKDET
jgi:uncharacterized membrane protein